MLIDWFTVGAQLLNFVILVWLMKRFLYQPVLDAIAAREQKIAAELADAAATKAEAHQQHDEFQKKNQISTNSARSCCARPGTQRRPNASVCSSKPARQPMLRAPGTRKRC